MWYRYKYLWFVLIGWAVFFVLQLLRTPLAFWIGTVAGLVLSIMTFLSSGSRLGKPNENVLLHGLAWTLAVALGLLSGVYIYAVLRGV